MAKLTKPLTNTETANAKPKEKDYTLSDGKGLYLLVKSGGSKLWRFEYKRPFTKKKALISMGRYPETTLQQARAKRDEYLYLLAQNIDPQQYKEQTERLEQQRITNTFRSVAENWKESKDGNIKPLTLSKYWGIIENYLMPKLADYPISEVTPLLAKSVLEIPYKQGKAEMYRKKREVAQCDFKLRCLFAVLNPY
ncbi:integrase arm-type DNA-binding domain-containing protein [Glaesserella parasuis]|uniref:integrase arm-type DNA-binding domain-containing protein n=1 Tax=Glaesserella parasuis TaxID=738 RepID=UPI001F1CB604|nr:integrase arm-type DNA-binding domain-containing protein [Glaesserella parasuis]MDG6268449.1 integrase arm-type DNA-binding domain-containing protein [Glaesserella parasuis]